MTTTYQTRIARGLCGDCGRENPTPTRCRKCRFRQSAYRARRQREGGPVRKWAVPAVQSVLLAVASFGPAGAGIEELIVAVWEQDRDRFGMRGFDAPDSKRVVAELYKKGSTSVIGRGWIEQVEGTGGLKAGSVRARYRVTEAGADVAAGLKGMGAA